MELKYTNSQNPEAGRVRALIEALYGRSELGKIRAAEELGQMGEAARPAMLPLIEAYGLLERNCLLSEVARKSLTKIGVTDEEIFSVLKEIIKRGEMHFYGNSHVISGEFAANALATFGAPAIPALLEAKSYNEHSQKHVYNSFVRITDPEAIPIIINKVERTGRRDPWFLHNTLNLIKEIPHPAAIPFLKNLLESGTAKFYNKEEFVFMTLGAMQDESSVPILKKYLESENKSYIELASEALKLINTPEAIYELTTFSLKTLATPFNMESGYDDDNLQGWKVFKRVIASRVLVSIGNPLAIPLLKPKFLDPGLPEQNPKLWFNVAYGLLSIKTKEAREIVVSKLTGILEDKNESSDKKVMVMEILGGVNDSSLIPLIASFKSNSDKKLSDAAFEAARNIKSASFSSELITKGEEEEKEEIEVNSKYNSIDNLIPQALFEKSEIKRYRAVQALSIIRPLGEHSITTFLEVSSDPFASEALREAAKEAVTHATVDKGKVVQELLEDLNSEKDELFQMASYALAGLDASAVSALFEAKSKMGVFKRGKLNDSVKCIKDPKAAPVLIEELKKDAEDKVFFANGIMVLADLGNPVAVPYLTYLLKLNIYRQVHREVIIALGRLGSESEVPELMQILQLGNKELFPDVAEAVFKIGTPEIRRELVPYLLNKTIEVKRGQENLRSYNTEEGVVKAAVLLGKIGDSSFTPLIIPLLSDPNPKVWTAAIKGLLEIGSEEALTAAREEVLKRLSVSIKDSNDFLFAIKFLDKVKDFSFLSVLERSLFHRNPFIQLYAKLGLKEIGSKEAKGLVEEYGGLRLFGYPVEDDLGVKDVFPDIP